MAQGLECLVYNLSPRVRISLTAVFLKKIWPKMSIFTTHSSLSPSAVILTSFWFFELEEIWSIAWDMPTVNRRRIAVNEANSGRRSTSVTSPTMDVTGLNFSRMLVDWLHGINMTLAYTSTSISFAAISPLIFEKILLLTFNNTVFCCPCSFLFVVFIHINLSHFFQHICRHH